MKKALILGIGGQDGSYLADILLERDYEVHGLYRRSSVDNLTRIAHVWDKVVLHQGDITDPPSILRITKSTRPGEIYNMADQDHVGWSLDTSGVSFDVTAKAVATTLEIIREVNEAIRFFQPCSAMMFGDAPPPQNETTPHNPQSPYACAKTAAYHLARYYRQVHGMFVTTAILYNHDSERRKGDYLLHQLRQAAWDVLDGKTEEIAVGDPEMIVDIGHAKDYMKAAVELMELDYPDDFIIASENPRTIRQIIDGMMNVLGCENYLIKTDPSLLRPGKQPTLIGDITKIKRATKWRPSVNSWILPMMPPARDEL